MELLSWLYHHYGQEQMRPGLGRIKSALGKLVPSLNQSKVIIVAGTNGKGETTLRLSHLLASYSHVVWTSPHIKRLTERFRDESGEISFDELELLIHECHLKVVHEKWELSFYEFLFLVFCTWASRKNPQFLLLEVGLGGRLDAVNVFDADLVLLPSLSRDHQEILGHRYDQILSEKLGTLRSKSFLIHFLENDYLTENTELLVKKVGATVMAMRDLVNLPSYEFSERNHFLACAAYCYLLQRPFLPQEWRQNQFLLEHRGEILTKNHEWIFFGSHNIDGLRKLIQFLHSGTYNFKSPPFDAVIVAFSKRSFSDLRIMMRMLKKAQIGEVIVTVFDHPKAAPVDEIKLLALKEGFRFVQDIEAYVQGKNNNQHILVTGSYYFLGYFKSLSCCQ
jgi:dihydrofolate synthase/folylpolyglutamate synthase